MMRDFIEITTNASVKVLINLNHVSTVEFDNQQLAITMIEGQGYWIASTVCKKEFLKRLLKSND